jgi:uncharacterized damage-inducible protein DinB
VSRDNLVEDAFLKQAIKHLEEDFLPKIRKCVESLSDEELWWRPNSGSNSAGNLLLHLTGNVRQWIIAGIGRTEDTRVRDREFSEQGPITTGQLLGDLESTVVQACAVLSDLPSESLLEIRKIQKYEVTLLQAIFHVVEHFSGHTGQIIYLTKLLKNQDLRFYDL